MKDFEYLRDKQFLKDITKFHLKDFYVQIIVLDWEERPIQNIEGRILSGSFTIDGKSAIRRTGNLSAIVKDNTKQEISRLFALNKKVSIKVGFANPTDYYKDDPIIWFPLGYYVIINCSIQNSLSGLTLSIQLKDKMCLLNGQCGGTLPAATVFDHYDIRDENGQWAVSKPTIYQIIYELVNHFGKQQLGKIIISDLDTKVKQLMQWVGNTPLYMLQWHNNNGSEQYWYGTSQGQKQEQINEIKKGKNKDYLEQEYTYGMDVGYIYIDYVYPGELIGEAGNSVVDILEKIKSTLTNYEYFYDVFGNFIFRQKKNYLNNSQSSYVRSVYTSRKTFSPDYIAGIPGATVEDSYLINTSDGKSVFTFDNELVNSYSNTPQYNMVKNDFTVWGMKKLSDNNNIAIRYRLVIDKKPKIGKKHENVICIIDQETKMEYWYKPVNINENELKNNKASQKYSYDNYYTCNGKVYKYCMLDQEDANGNATFGFKQVDAKLTNIISKDWRTELYFQGVEAQPTGDQSNDYFAQLWVEWPKIYDIKAGDFKEEYKKNPSALPYYLDFFDTDNINISQFNISNIGRRAKVWNNDKINCVFESYVPDVVFTNIKDIDLINAQQIAKDRGWNHIRLSDNIYSSLVIGGTQESAYDMIRQILHEYSNFNENIQLQVLPIYFLEPNTRITVNDIDSNIFGDYMINTLSFSFDVNSFLTINASKAVEKV